MWFRLAILPDRADLYAAVTLRGDILFRGDDVGRFLGYENPERFTSRHATIDLMKLISRLSACEQQCGKFGKLLCLTVEQLIEEMKKCFDRSEDVNEFINLWNKGVVDYNASLRPIVKPHKAKRLIVYKPDEAVYPFEKTWPLQEWIKMYVTFCRNYEHSNLMYASMVERILKMNNWPSAPSDVLAATAHVNNIYSSRTDPDNPALYQTSVAINPYDPNSEVTKKINDAMEQIKDEMFDDELNGR